MQARVDRVLIIFGTQVITKKPLVRPVVPDYLSISHGYDNAKQSGADVLKTTPKRAIKNTVKATGVLIGNKVTDKIPKFLRRVPQNCSGTAKMKQKMLYLI